MLETTVQPVDEESGEVIPPTNIQSSSWRLFILQVSGISLLFFSLLVVHALWRTGSMALVWPYLGGQRVFFEPTRLVIDAIPNDAHVLKREVRVINSASKTFRLLGAQKSCGCIALDEFPIIIPAGEEKYLRIKIAMPREPVSFEHSIKFFSNDPVRSSAVVTIIGIAP